MVLICLKDIMYSHKKMNRKAEQWFKYDALLKSKQCAAAAAIDSSCSKDAQTHISQISAAVIIISIISRLHAIEWNASTLTYTYFVVHRFVYLHTCVKFVGNIIWGRFHFSQDSWRLRWNLFMMDIPLCNCSKWMCFLIKCNCMYFECSQCTI